MPPPKSQTWTKMIAEIRSREDDGASRVIPMLADNRRRPRAQAEIPDLVA